MSWYHGINDLEDAIYLAIGLGALLVLLIHLLGGIRYGKRNPQQGDYHG